MRDYYLSFLLEAFGELDVLERVALTETLSVSFNRLGLVHESDVSFESSTSVAARESSRSRLMSYFELAGFFDLRISPGSRLDSFDSSDSGSFIVVSVDSQF